MFLEVTVIWSECLGISLSETFLKYRGAFVEFSAFQVYCLSKRGFLEALCTDKLLLLTEIFVFFPDN
jgi:hypothetical protein